jgi:hypothetical protein
LPLSVSTPPPWLALTAAAVILLPACSRKPTDEAQIRAVFADAVHAAEEKQVGEVMRGVSERFQGDGLDKRGVRQLVTFHVLRGSWVALTISGEQVSVHGDAADAVVDLVMVRSGKGRALAELLPQQATVHRFTMTLEREDDDWRVTNASWRPISLEQAAAGPAPAPPR